VKIQSRFCKALKEGVGRGKHLGTKGDGGGNQVKRAQ